MTHIYGTFGPACGSQETLEAMFRAGMTGMRLNLSHCDLQDSADMLRAFHAAAAGPCHAHADCTGGNGCIVVR